VPRTHDKVIPFGTDVVGATEETIAYTNTHTGQLFAESGTDGGTDEEGEGLRTAG